MKRFLIPSLAIALTCLKLAGCASLSPRSDPSRFFVLSPLPEVEEAQNLDSPGRLSLGVGPIKFPGYLDREQMVTRVAQNRFELSENDRWAEPLEENFTRVLSQNLSTLLRTDRIIPYPWASNKHPNYQVHIEVLRFEANAAQDAQLLARWAVLDGSDKKPLQYRESHLTQPGKSKTTEAAVAALSEAVGALSREIADAIRAVDGQRRP